MEQARLAREYLDTLAWPIVVLALVLVFLSWFRPQIAELIRNIRALRGPGGTGVDVAPSQPSGSAETPPTPPELSAAIAQKEGELEQLQQSAQSLRQQATLYGLYWSYEKTYRLIFGTQIALLQQLNLMAAAGADFQFVSSFHSQHLQQVRVFNPRYDYPVTSYIGFLQTFNLVHEQGGRYYITDVGRGFLQWMILESVAPAKAL
jgi:hypothetical protein